MDKSPKSAKLEEYARGLENAYDDFVRAMGFLPQRKGVDRELTEFCRFVNKMDGEEVKMYFGE